MAAIALDPMEFMQQLEASGMPRSQAEAVAKGYTAMIVHNLDALVTKDYLDSRFAEFESKMGLRFAEAENRTDGRFKDLESRIDLRIADFESRINLRFADSESRMDIRFAETDGKFKELESKMDLRFAEFQSKMDVSFARVNVIQGILLVAIAIPMLQTILTWLR
jgi:hypothetical protein